MKKIKLVYITDLILFIQFILVGGSGLIMYFFHHVGGNLLRVIHDQVGVLMLFFFAVHMVLNWKWILNTTKKFSKKGKKIKENYIVDLILFIQFILVGGSGLFMYFYHHAGGYMLRFIHDQIGVIMLCFFVVHVALHWRWMFLATKNFFFIEKEAERCKVARTSE